MAHNSAMNRLVLMIADRIAPAWARQRRFELWLDAENRLVALELTGRKGSVEWLRIRRLVELSRIP